MVYHDVPGKLALFGGALAKYAIVAAVEGGGCEGGCEDGEEGKID